MSRTLIRFTLGAVLLGLIGCSQHADDAADESTDAIVGGTEARADAWPGAVAVYFGSQQGCGGSLVADSWVVTAGHCIIEPSATNGGVSSVVIGRHSLSEAAEGEVRIVDRAIRHEGFNSILDNDIALLHLASPTTAPKVELVTADENGSVVAGKTVTVVGWGTTREGAASTSDVLRQVSVPIISHEKCVTYTDYEDITQNMICAGLSRGGKDSCQGDSGGPLFMSIRGRKVQVGLVSWGIGCARARAPGIYTRVGNYLAWMHETSGGEIGSGSAAD